MEPRILNLKEKKLVGKKVTMSIAENKAKELWSGFIPRRKEITKKLTSDFISLSVYNPSYFLDFKLTNEFEKWAAVEVSDFTNVPNDMETFTISEGLYAVFDYKGSSSDISIFQYIFGVWLPKSEYLLDNRPHFEVLGEKYKNNDPNSEEEIWIPLKLK
ncbi:MAG TPA: GyrI-like domain-containing protein [Candidatus Kapabacteria bacterium]|nr:GyrI-like domain-containing protein [Candidatus Kapabacteria bacterium]HPO62606.1 GyrI-like domain-containing protein [Candidatus Kapabacteria bacterium]